MAAGLATLTVDELIGFYRSTGPEMFQRTRFLDRLNSLYRNGPLQQQLKPVFGETTDLKPAVSRPFCWWSRATSPPIHRGRSAATLRPRYNLLSRGDCNLCIPLWKLVRASTAAPIYFPPEVIQPVPTTTARRSCSSTAA